MGPRSASGGIRSARPTSFGGSRRPTRRAYLELANEIDALMNFALPYMTTHPTRPAPGGLIRGGLRSLRHPKRLGKLGRYMTASHAEVIEESFSNRMVRGLLAALPCFAPITQDGTAWVLVYFGLHPPRGGQPLRRRHRRDHRRPRPLLRRGRRRGALLRASRRDPGARGPGHRGTAGERRGAHGAGGDHDRQREERPHRDAARGRPLRRSSPSGRVTSRRREPTRRPSSSTWRCPGASSSARTRRSERTASTSGYRPSATRPSRSTSTPGMPARAASCRTRCR